MLVRHEEQNISTQFAPFIKNNQVCSEKLGCQLKFHLRLLKDTEIWPGNNVLFPVICNAYSEGLPSFLFTETKSREVTINKCSLQYFLSILCLPVVILKLVRHTPKCFQ